MKYIITLAALLALSGAALAGDFTLDNSTWRTNVDAGDISTQCDGFNCDAVTGVAGVAGADNVTFRDSDFISRVDVGDVTTRCEGALCSAYTAVGGASLR